MLDKPKSAKVIATAKRREARAALGLCRYCGKERDDLAKQACSDCHIKSMNRKKAYRARVKIEHKPEAAVLEVVDGSYQKTETVTKPGQLFGFLTAMRRINKPGGHVFWECECICGTIKVVRGTYLRTGLTKSCGSCGHLLPGPKKKIVDDPANYTSPLLERYADDDDTDVFDLGEPSDPDIVIINDEPIKFLPREIIVLRMLIRKRITWYQTCDLMGDIGIIDERKVSPFFQTLNDRLKRHDRCGLIEFNREESGYRLNRKFKVEMPKDFGDLVI